MLLDLADTSIQRYIYFLREWEPNEAKIIKSALREGDVFLDLGANVGYFSLLAAQVVGATGKVYAFEAQPAICVQLKENVNLNGFVNVQIMNLAIADRISDFIVEDVSGLGNRGAAMLIPREPGMPVIKVAGTTIDEFCRSQQVKDVGLIKMDIEGSEMLALKGMRDLLSTPNAPDMLCEINEPLLKRMGSSGNEIYSYMSGMGYQMYQSSKRGLERVVAKEFAAHSDPLGDNYFFSKRLDLPEQFSI